MIGIILALTSGIFREVGTSIGKHKTQNNEETIYTMGFLNVFWALIFFMLFAVFVRGEFVFMLASLPTLIPRIFLEIAQAHFTMKAVHIADRSTFGFLRAWTLPLLLVVDIFLGYTIGIPQMLGITFIVIAFLFLFISHGIRKKGAGFVMFTAINAVITASLFKYNITHFNSVETEQIIVGLIILLYFFLMARHMGHEKPFTLLRNPTFFAQSFFMGIGSILISFAMFLAPASIIMTIKRASTILWSIVSGNVYFREKKLRIKIIAFTLIATGVVFLTL